MVERPTTGRIESTGKGKLKIIARGTETTLTEQAAPRKVVDHGNPEKIKKTNFPKGAIESLRPLLRDISGTDISEDADGYWMNVDKMATMTPQTAVNRLKRAGLGHVEAALLLVKSDPQINIGMALNNFTEEVVDAKISEVANLLLPYFQTKIPKK